MKIARWAATAGVVLGLGLVSTTPAMASTRAFRAGSVQVARYRPAAPVTSSASTTVPECQDYLLGSPLCPPPILFIRNITP
jgi:hypothetical protein